MSDWQPIATAPKDGTPFLAYQPAQEKPYSLPAMMMVMEWADPLDKRSFSPSWVGGWDSEWDLTKPTHWKPLPAAPA